MRSMGPTDLYEAPPCVTCRLWIGPGLYRYEDAPGWCPLHELRTWAAGGCRRHTALDEAKPKAKRYEEGHFASAMQKVRNSLGFWAGEAKCFFGGCA